MKYWQLVWFIVRNFKLSAKVMVKELVVRLAKEDTSLSLDAVKLLEELQQIHLANIIYNPTEQQKAFYKQVIESKTGRFVTILPDGDILVIGPSFSADTLRMKKVGGDSVLSATQTPVEKWYDRESNRVNRHSVTD